MHGFGLASAEAVSRFPFHSVDASSWVFAPAAMGMWAGFSGKQVSLKARGVKDYWVEVLEHQKRSRMAATRWRRELASLARSR